MSRACVDFRAEKVARNRASCPTFATEKATERIRLAKSESPMLENERVLVSSRSVRKSLARTQTRETDITSIFRKLYFRGPLFRCSKRALVVSFFAVVVFFFSFFFFFFFFKNFPLRSFPTRLSLWTRAPRLEDSLRATNNVKRRLQHPGVSRAVPNHSWNYVILLVGETSPAPAPGQGIFSCVLCKRVSVAFRCQGSRGEQRYPRKYRHACTYFVAVHSEPVLLCLNDSRFSSNKHRCEMIFASGPRERLSYDTVRGQCS